MSKTIRDYLNEVKHIELDDLSDNDYDSWEEIYANKIEIYDDDEIIEKYFVKVLKGKKLFTIGREKDPIYQLNNGDLLSPSSDRGEIHIIKKNNASALINFLKKVKT